MKRVGRMTRGRQSIFEVRRVERYDSIRAFAEEEIFAQEAAAKPTGDYRRSGRSGQARKVLFFLPAA